jgi:hypothetical protein
LDSVRGRKEIQLEVTRMVPVSRYTSLYCNAKRAYKPIWADYSFFCIRQKSYFVIESPIYIHSYDYFCYYIILMLRKWSSWHRQICTLAPNPAAAAAHKCPLFRISFVFEDGPVKFGLAYLEKRYAFTCFTKPPVLPASAYRARPGRQYLRLSPSAEKVTLSELPE